LLKLTAYRRNRLDEYQVRFLLSVFAFLANSGLDPFWMSDGYRAMDQREAIKVMVEP
jgi:hypothetical protein